MINTEKLTDRLNMGSLFFKRLALKKLLQLEKTNAENVPTLKNLIPLHFSSTESYSLYSPTMCAYIAHRSGFFGLGINDYATLKYSKEFKKACKILKMPFTCGYNVDCKPLFGESSAYLYAYGIPCEMEGDYLEILSKVRKVKFENTLKLLDRLNEKLKVEDVFVSKELLIKEAKKRRGLLTEKHLAKSLAQILVKKFGTGKGLIDFIAKNLDIVSCEGEARFLNESENLYFTDDLAKVIYLKYLKPKIKKSIFDCKEFIDFNSKRGVISSYLLNVEKFDEEYLTKVATELRRKGFDAVTIRVSLLNEEELQKIVKFFIENEMIALPFYNLGLPRQFIHSTEDSEINYKMSLAVIGNSVSTSFDTRDGMFKPFTISKCPDLNKRIELFANIGKRER